VRRAWSQARKPPKVASRGCFSFNTTSQVRISSRHAVSTKHSAGSTLSSTEVTVYRVTVMHELKDLCSDTTICQRSANQELERTVCSDIHHRTVRFNGRHHLLPLAFQTCFRPILAFDTYGKRNNNAKKAHEWSRQLYRQPSEQGRALGSSASTKYTKPVGAESTKEPSQRRQAPRQTCDQQGYEASSRVHGCVKRISTHRAQRVFGRLGGVIRWLGAQESRCAMTFSRKNNTTPERVHCRSRSRSRSGSEFESSRGVQPKIPVQGGHTRRKRPRENDLKRGTRVPRS
jgi:hypothetical protein